MPETHLGTACGSWSAKGHSVRIEYSHSAMDEIRAAAVEGFCWLRHGGVEVGGILFGVREGPLVRILAQRPVLCEHAFGPSFVLSEADKARCEDVFHDREMAQAGLLPVGWFQSRTRGEIDFASGDAETLGAYFPEPWQVSIIVHPDSFGGASFAFFFRKRDGSVATGSDEERLVIRPQRTKSRMAAVSEAESPPADSAAAAVAPRPAAAPRRMRARRRLAWIWPALAVAVLSLAVAAVWRHSSQQPVHAVPLRVWDRDGQLRIEWDRTARAVLDARGGALEIVDGATRVELPFDAGRLRSGSVTYARRSGNVDVRLRVYGPGAPVEEFARFVGQPLRQAVAPAGVPPEAPVATNAKETRPPAQPPEETAGNAAGVRAAAPDAERTAPEKSSRAAPAPMRQLPVAQKKRSAPILPPPPITTGLTAAPRAAMSPAPQLAAHRIQAPAPAPAKPQPAPVYTGPVSGRLIWTGRLPRRTLLSIQGKRASAGFVTGELPGVPVKISAYPAELSSKGLRVYSPDPKYSFGDVLESPGPENGWNRTAYTWNPRRANELIVLEPPAAQNGWKGITLRGDDRQFAVIVIDWRVIR